jgi:acyl-CoA dehydrogenase
MAAGGAMLAEEALAAIRTAGQGADSAGRMAAARFFAENLAVQSGALERTVIDGADSVIETEAALAGA